MKITKRQLKRIIREENLKLNEMFPGDIRSGVGRSVNQTMGRDESPKPGEVERSLADKIAGDEVDEETLLSWMMSLDDVMDDVIEEAAPKIVQKILEREVDEDVEEFHDGAMSAALSHRDVMDMRAEKSIMNPDMSNATPAYQMGWNWMEKNNFDASLLGKTGDAFGLPDQQRIALAQAYRSEIEDHLTEEFVIDLLEKAWAIVMDKVETLGFILEKIKKSGWLGFIVFMMIEAFEHYVLPKLLYGIIGPAALVLAAVPAIEILAIVGLIIYDIFKKREPYVEPPPGHFDLAFTPQGNLEIQKKINEGMALQGRVVLTENQLRKVVRNSIRARL